MWQSDNDPRVGHPVFKSSLMKGMCRRLDLLLSFGPSLPFSSSHFYVLEHHSYQFLFYLMYSGVWAACVSMQCISAQELPVQCGLFKPLCTRMQELFLPTFLSVN